MQRSSTRSYSPSPSGGLFTTKSGTIDRHKLILVLICSLLALWVIYDTSVRKRQKSRSDRRKRRPMSCA